MPRGKVTSEMLKFVADTGDAEVKEQEKNSPAPAKFTLIQPEAEHEEDELVQSVHKEFSETMETTRPNFKFTLLLVTLFVAVNIGLIALLDDNKKSTPQANTEENNVPIVNLDKQAPATTNADPEKPVLATQSNAEKPALASTGVTLQKPLPAATAAASATTAKEKPAGKHQPAADLLSIISKY